MSLLFRGARKLDAAGQVDDFWMLVIGDSIVATGIGQAPTADSTVDLHGRWLTPGFFDLHSHGGGGFSYDSDVESIQGGLAFHRAHGTTRSVVSLVANPIAALIGSIKEVTHLMSSDPLILGSHLEGPFISSKRRGAHKAAFLRTPGIADVECLLDAADGTLLEVTMAPELPNAFEMIGVLSENKVVVSVGHSEADFALTQRAFDAGATLLTHAFNAMPGIGHRAPGPVVAAFEDERVTLELILDGEHVHPDVVALAFRSAPGRVALITDAIAAAGAPDGRYDLGTVEVEVHDGLSHVAGTTTLAGSTLTQDRALRLAIEKVGLEPANAVAALTLIPARVLGLGHRHGLLAPGFVADAVQLDSRWQVEHVWANGLALS